MFSRSENSGLHAVYLLGSTVTSPRGRVNLDDWTPRLSACISHQRTTLPDVPTPNAARLGECHRKPPRNTLPVEILIYLPAFATGDKLEKETNIYGTKCTSKPDSHNTSSYYSMNKSKV